MAEKVDVIEIHVEQIREVLILNGYPDPDDTEHTCPLAALHHVEDELSRLRDGLQLIVQERFGFMPDGSTPSEFARSLLAGNPS